MGPTRRNEPNGTMVMPAAAERTRAAGTYRANAAPVPQQAWRSEFFERNLQERQGAK
jgi:hypothetical protein